MKRKLTLRGETIRELSATQIRIAAGGLPKNTMYCSVVDCPTDTNCSGAISICFCLTGTR